MDIVLLAKAAIMGVVEGLTEFLPVSSTGHLILAGALLGFDDEKAKVFDIAIQTGAIFAVILVYWQKIRATLVALPTEKQAQQFALNVLIAFVPAVLLGLLFGKAIKAHLFTPVVVATTFIIGGFIILWAEVAKDQCQCRCAGAQRGRDDRHGRFESGLVQCLAMVPGTSRSGATIIGGMLLGLSRKAATGFFVLFGHAHADRGGRIQPVQRACVAQHGRCADVRRRFGVFVPQRMDLRALAAALHFEPQFCAVCLLPHCLWPGGAGHRVDGLGEMGGLKAFF